MLFRTRKLTIFDPERNRNQVDGPFITFPFGEVGCCQIKLGPIYY